ncbi:cytochrome P450 4V2-like [Varroa jacobsoni]|uniref:cytochrome P450 4V2-like n=1 Tax=Varroa jacobsoni TaxID=62625 RepID=UPI000BF3C4BC|nr:cytochrome P450 4V2-like [Varroa jacobsoni]
MMLPQSTTLLTLVSRIFFTTAITFAVAIVIGFAFLRYRRNKTYRFLKEFPGWFEPIPLIRHLCFHYSILNSCKGTGIPYGVYLNDMLQGMTFMWLLKNKGAVVSYLAGEPRLLLLQADHVEKILTHPRNLRKGFGYDFMAPWLSGSILLTAGTRWKAKRRLLVPAFHFHVLDEFSSVINKYARVFMNRVMTKDREDDLVQFISALTLDIVCDAIMGVSIHSQTSQSGQKYLQGISRLSELIILRMQNILHWSDWIYQFSEAGQEFYSILDSVHGFTGRIIDDRKAKLLSNPKSLSTTASSTASKPKAFLDVMLQLYLAGEMSAEDIRYEADALVFAGHDTTSMALTYAIYLIGLHHDVQQKLQQEVDALIEGKNLDRNDISSEEVRSLKYMDMVLKESQRIYPSVPSIGRVLDDDMQIDGKTVPRGTNVSVDLFGLHRDPTVFPCPEEFIPERFGADAASRKPFTFVPFSAGPRNCIGQRFALLEEKITLCHLLARYDWISLDPRDKLQLVSNIVLRPRSKIRVVFRARKTSCLA